MEYILLTAFMGCAIAALGPRIVFIIMTAIPASFVVLFLVLNSSLSPWCTTCSKPAVKIVAQPRASYVPDFNDPRLYDCKAPLGQASSFQATRKACRDAGGKLEFDPDEYLHSRKG